MVLRHALISLVLLAGCKQSLFDSHGEPDASTGDGGNFPSSCPATCLGDAAADFGMPSWRYLDDTRNRAWAPMTMMGNDFVGMDNNRIWSCRKDGSPEACKMLPGALLVTNSGTSTAADPALSFTATANQVIQLSVRVYVPMGAQQQEVRLYRNAREDSLFTGLAPAGGTFDRAITVDALNGDRFYLSVGGSTAGATEKIGVHFYVNATTDAFPKDCQLALPFAGPMANTTDNVCGVDFAYKNADTAATWALGQPPFPEMGTSADITRDKYFVGSDVLVRSGDTTTQLWLRHDAFVDTYGTVVFSDDDLDNTGGLTIYVANTSPPKLGAETCTVVTQTTLDFAWAEGTYPDDHAWHFVRVVHTNGMVKICVDGARTASYALPAGKMQGMYPPWLGRNLNWTPTGGFLDGAIDDVRVFTGALPCE